MNDRNRKANATEEPRQRPAHELRLGRIKATIWANATDAGVRHNVTLARLYRDGAEWKQSASFGREDLPLVVKVCDLAHTWIYQHGREAQDPDA